MSHSSSISFTPMFDSFPSHSLCSCFLNSFFERHLGKQKGRQLPKPALPAAGAWATPKYISMVRTQKAGSGIRLIFCIPTQVQTCMAFPIPKWFDTLPCLPPSLLFSCFCMPGWVAGQQLAVGWGRHTPPYLEKGLL